MHVEPGYVPLAKVLQFALNQAQHGKGKERHANDKPFLQQPIMEIGRMVGAGYNIGQAMKKAQEAMRLPPERARAELLGAINYLAAAYLLSEEQQEKQSFLPKEIKQACMRATQEERIS